MNPAITTVWYGGTAAAVCMGTSGKRTFTQQAFYSVPGPGATNVPIAENTSELPFTPDEAVGLGDEPYLAPVIPLWDEGSAATLQAATITSAEGTSVPSSLVTPETPTPQAPSNFPSVPTFGGYTTASFVVPRTKFKKDTSYVLTATWQGPEGVSIQTVPFKTAATDLNGQIEAAEHTEINKNVTGSYTTTLRSRSLTILASGLYIGQTATVTIEPCGRIECDARHPWTHRVKLQATPIKVTVPLPRRGKRALLAVRTPSFAENGQRYEAQGTSYQLYWNRVAE